MKLFVDDVRGAPEGWVLCRTIKTAIAHLAQRGVETVSLDMDAGYLRVNSDGAGVVVEQEDFSAVAWAIALMRPEERPRVFVHSSNTNALELVRSILPKENVSYRKP